MIFSWLLISFSLEGEYDLFHHDQRLYTVELLHIKVTFLSGRIKITTKTSGKYRLRSKWPYKGHSVVPFWNVKSRVQHNTINLQGKSKLCWLLRAIFIIVPPFKQDIHLGKLKCYPDKWHFLALPIVWFDELPKNLLLNKSCPKKLWKHI